MCVREREREREKDLSLQGAHHSPYSCLVPSLVSPCDALLTRVGLREGGPEFPMPVQQLGKVVAGPVPPGVVYLFRQPYNAFAVEIHVIPVEASLNFAHEIFQASQTSTVSPDGSSSWSPPTLY